MKCPFCGYAESKVIDSRPTDENERIRRRRECMQCGKRFTTYEIIEDVPIIVVKKDKSREVFDRNKILKGMLRACEKRPVTVEALETAISEIETTLQSALDREVTSVRIGELIMEKLRGIDEVLMCALLLFTRSLTAPVPLWTKFPNCNKPVSRPAFVGCFFLFYLGY